MDLEPLPPSGDSLKCCSCSCCLSWDDDKSLKRKFDQINRSCLVAGSDNGESSSLARVEIENECSALREALSGQQQSMQRLCGELEEERSASASAANEAMSMILRLQREKAEIQMEARQYKRYADEKMAHDQQELLEMEDMLYRKDQIIYSLSYEVEAYKHRIMSLGYTEAEAEGMIVDAGGDGHISSQIMGGIGNNHETPFDYPPLDYPPLKCELKETHVLQDPGIDAPLDLDKYAFGETPHAQEQFQNVECEIHQLERNPSSNQIDGDYFTTKNFIEKATVGQSPRWPRHARRFSTESSSSLLGIAKETGQEDYSFLKKVDNASDVGDDMSDRVYTVDSVQGVPYNGEAKINIGICNDYLTGPRESLARFDMGETDIKKLYIRLQALEADRESLRQEIVSMRTNKAQLMLMKEMSQLLCKKMSPEKRVVVKKRSLFGGFSFPSLLKWIASFVFWRRKPRRIKYMFEASSNNLGLLLLLDQSPCVMRKWIFQRKRASITREILKPA
ncbi:myosin-binding protein 7-like protein [Cinnamomum micranthum f. kanehirae]|uniref:Myosin-binding protein 7-like protein n=1 Tax=Cinnamomum micranthum f. kanehirae TaxID=337451 RepID=A0A443NP93_9MAGN|nr:myosin-binding protein 7-like protein [Cinnamomum micranthum f. kanehirae]